MTSCMTNKEILQWAIAELGVEKRMEELDTALADPAIASDHTKLTELSKEREELEGKLEALMEQWEELAE